ncbi:Callose synthase 7, partial [Tetrabaena socialis]
MVTIHMGIWVQLLLLLGGVGKSGANGSFAAAIGAVQILQLGSFPLLGHIFNLWLESGLATALVTVVRQIIGGGLLFYIFRSATSAYHMGRAVLFGGASYIATGRGFSLRRKTFTQVYVNYGRSHLYLGADILMMVTLILVVANNGGNALPVPMAAMWSPLLVSASLLATPFWFTPFFFRLSQVLRDTREFRAWVNGSGARGVRSYRFWSTLAVVLPRAIVAILSALVAVTGARFEAAD